MTDVISLILWKDPQATSCQWFKQWKEKPAHCTPYNQQLFQKIKCLSITETTSVLPLVSHLWHWLLPSLGGDLYTALVLHISKLQGHKWLCIYFKGKKKKKSEVLKVSCLHLHFILSKFALWKVTTPPPDSSYHCTVTLDSY